MRPETSSPIARITFSNGATVIAEPDDRFQSAAIGFWFDFGSSRETDVERGFTHFVEHMVFKGTGRRKAEDIAREIDRVGGYLNAYTEREETCFHCAIPQGRVGLAVDVLSDMLFASTFDPEEFLRERDVIRNETLAALDEPEEAGSDEFAARLWPGDPYGRRIAGTPEEVMAIERDPLFAFYRDRFAPERLVVVAVGAVDIAELEASLEAALPPGRYGSADCLPAIPAATVFKSALGAPIKQTHLYTGIPLDPPFEPDEYWLLAIVNSAFGDAASSRLFLELRERRGLCYSAGSGFSLSPSAGFWTAFAATTPERFPELLEGYRILSRSLHEKGLVSGEIAEAKSRIAGSMLLGADDLEYRMKRLIRQFFFDRTLEPVETSVRRVSSFSDELVNEIISRRLDPRRESVFAYGSIPRGVKAAVAASGLKPGKGRS
ncbi:MAG: pitrilysin family protein [Spirochaetes bacterium]|nr:pitrilysin family protein [Spirochaetota bacterium]